MGTKRMMNTRRDVFECLVLLASIAAPSAQADYLYTLDNNQNIIQISPSGQITPFYDGTRSFSPVTLATDGKGNLFSLQTGSGQVLRLGGGSVQAIATVGGFNRFIAANSMGNLYVSDNNSGTLSRIAPDGSIVPISFMAGGYIAADPAGNVYGDSFQTGYNVVKFNSGSAPTTYFTGRSGSLAADGAGNLYIDYFPGASANSSLVEVTPTGAVSTLASDFGDITALAADADGQVLIALTMQLPNGQYSSSIDQLKAGSLVPIAAIGAYTLAASPTPIDIPEPGFVSIAIGALGFIARRRRFV